MIKTPKKVNEERLRELMKETAEDMRKTYSNRSTDEYKMRGDITKSEHYHTFEKLVNDLFTLKHFPTREANDIKTMFLTLHRPIWKKMVADYLAKPTVTNRTYTISFTLGYRVLRGELARIYSCTEATEKGIVYKYNKIAMQESIYRFIRRYNEKLDEILAKSIEAYKDLGAETLLDKSDNKPVQEGAVATVATETVDVAVKLLGVIKSVFKTAAELNPISFVSAILSRSYDKKIEKYEETCALYLATKEAYDDYKRIPEKDRNKKIESKYAKNIEKYNIKMNNLRAKIDHFDQRAHVEADDALNAPVKSSAPKKETPKKEPADDNKSDDNDGFDF